MTQADFHRRCSFDKEELRAYIDGTLLEDQTDQSAAPPPLVFFDRILHIEHNGSRGRIIAEQDKFLDSWHPGSSGIDAIWQLLAFYLAVRGVPGAGLALGCKEINCKGQIRSHHSRLRYDVSVTLVSQLRQSGASIAMGDGVILSDGETICTVRDAQVAAFTAIQQDPSASSSHRGSSSARPQAERPHQANA